MIRLYNAKGLNRCIREQTWSLQIVSSSSLLRVVLFGVSMTSGKVYIFSCIIKYDLEPIKHHSSRPFVTIEASAVVNLDPSKEGRRSSGRNNQEQTDPDAEVSKA